MDISHTLEPDSDQLDAIELVSGPRTFVIEKVSKGSAEQPVQVYLKDFPRPWRPGKSMRRVLAACWGVEASVWVGRSVTLFCDESIRFGSEVVGGTRIRALSHLDKVKKVPLLVSRGKAAMYTVEPLKESPPAKVSKPTSPSPEDIAGCTDDATLRAWWKAGDNSVRALVEARVDELNRAKEAEPDPWAETAASVAARDATLDGE